MVNKSLTALGPTYHSLPADWQPTTGWPPVAPDRNRYKLDSQILTLCVPCARSVRRRGVSVIACKRRLDCHCAETDAGCSDCGAGGEDRQLELDEIFPLGAVED